MMKALGPDIHEMLALRISKSQEEAFARYADEVLAWNKRFNLTAIQSVEDVRVRHFLDSLSCWQAMSSQSFEKVIDIGSGAGFPGLPLKIIQASMQLSLVESVGKKARFLEHMVQDLGLNGVEVANERAEDLGKRDGWREKFDWAIARAVAPLAILAEYMLPFVRVGGFMLAQKGRKAADEIESAREAIRQLGGGNTLLKRVRVPGLEGERNLVIIEKTGKTPERFPRRAGIPAKRPL